MGSDRLPVRRHPGRRRPRHGHRLHPVGPPGGRLRTQARLRRLHHRPRGLHRGLGIHTRQRLGPPGRFAHRRRHRRRRPEHHIRSLRTGVRSRQAARPAGRADLRVHPRGHLPRRPGHQVPRRPAGLARPHRHRVHSDRPFGLGPVHPGVPSLPPVQGTGGGGQAGLRVGDGDPRRAGRRASAPARG